MRQLNAATDTPASMEKPVSTSAPSSLDAPSPRLSSPVYQDTRESLVFPMPTRQGLGCCRAVGYSQCVPTENFYVCIFAKELRLGLNTKLEERCQAL
ncbi:hypothetical protein F441_14679 [Phytophthora nicotianae CJ01A1]|uniref:Uncharacterized protein n=5 Tax=Phytophthora nicotianae TaxID=4792 RepID=V9EKW3_PHYNI|nr:hypothetical protein F443_14845 [Phytophthora nicotianae P1569]ETK79744.1 hypothetical protein L915_14424 [Phytophthora nicotianae]ETO68315.1 hypothetical protein F444_14840 [Phytophthora nicotianae P1976]ETP09457.1 hypothetical protein F441_14679 [Phytophthora nicotianae CJ01A1]ETP37513.1 hypothetical protein F442_14687 [Phytophthora nicotianae P10297]